MNSKPIEIKSDATVVTSQKWTVELTGPLILYLLRWTGHKIPDGAAVTFTVPGGADWSNTSIDIDADNPIRVAWQSQSVESRSFP